MSNLFDLIEINIEEDLAYIKGTQVKVGDILKSLESGLSLEEVVERTPALTREMVRAAIAYRNRYQYARC